MVRLMAMTAQRQRARKPTLNATFVAAMHKTAPMLARAVTPHSTYTAKVASIAMETRHVKTRI